jgi:hypothetical protein
LGSDLSLKPIEVVTHRHGQRQELFKCLLGLIKRDRNAAGFQPYAFRQVLQLLRQNLNRGFHQQLGAFQSFFLTRRQGGCNFAPTLDFIMALLALGQTAQMRNENIAIRQPIGADAVHYAGGHDLLGSASTDTEQEFDGRAVDERAGKNFELPDHVIDFAQPAWFCRHGCFIMLVRACAKRKSIE